MHLMRILKAAISLGYWLANRATDSLRRFFGSENAARCMVLYYHGITETQQPRFRRQMALLRSRAKVVPLTEVASPSGSGRQTCITFDDGLDSVRRNAIPILLEFGLPASIFVVSGNLGRKPQWEMAPGHPDAGESLMTPERLLRLSRHAIEVGSHTVSHPNLAALPPNEVRRELLQSKRDLEALVGRPVETLSLPYGEYNHDTMRNAREVGYKAILTCEPRVVSCSRKEFEIGRIRVTPEDWMLEFWLKASGAYCWLRYARWFKRACLDVLWRRPFAGGFRDADRRTGRAVSRD